MTKTKYYDLQMDDSQDNYDVEVVNANLKKIDEQMKTRENATDALQEPEFTVADKRENIASKEKMPKILGKIAKYFTDLKLVAFTGSYSDLDDKPTIDPALSSTSTNPVQNKAVNEAIDELKKSVSDGKTKVANAITDKGVKTATDATFDVMAKNISKIDTELHGATLAIRTADNELFGKTVTLTLNGANVGTTVFSNNGTCSFIVQQSGPYTITCGEAHKDVSVTNIDVLNKTTISVNLLLLKIVTFADGTDEEIAAMIKAHYNNKINISDYWAVGDTRSVSLSAMAASTVPETHRAQVVKFVIADFEHDTLTSGIGPRSKAAITLLQKDCLMDADNAANPINGANNTENGYMRGWATNEGGWDACARRGWCNSTYFNALPAIWQSMVKEVVKYTGKGGALSGTQTTLDKIFLPSEIEIFGDRNGSVKGEGEQYKYYKNAAVNKYKMPKWDDSKYTHSSRYLERSPHGLNKTEFCEVFSDGGMISQGANVSVGIAPMLCV